jgi:hypothetical protein
LVKSYAIRPTDEAKDARRGIKAGDVPKQIRESFQLVRTLGLRMFVSNTKSDGFRILVEPSPQKLRLISCTRKSLRVIIPSIATFYQWRTGYEPRLRIRRPSRQQRRRRTQGRDGRTDLVPGEQLPFRGRRVVLCR